MFTWLKKRKFNKIILENLDNLMQLAYIRCKNRELAEDLVQETCMKAYHAYLKMNEEDLKKPKSWLFKILINSYIDYSRKHKLSLVSIDEMEIEDKKDTFKEIESSLFFEDLNKALSRLEPQHRIIIYLADVDEFSYKEIADMLGVPQGTVMSRLYRARHSLRKILSASGYTKELVKASG